MSLVQAEVVRVLGAYGPTGQMIEVRLPSRLVCQSVLGSFSAGQKVLVDPQTTRVYSLDGKDLTLVPVPVSVRGHLGEPRGR